jgi:hypothetical protein
MTIVAKDTLLHWNYFLALEDDLGQLSRYIEFSEPNFNAYSIELAHLLLASASEVDVVAKRICQLLKPDARAHNINDYRQIITEGIQKLPSEPVFVPRFSLTLHPWSNWGADGRNPDWWTSYNEVKHHRDDHFQDANLKNTLNAVAALHLAVFHYYRLEHGLGLRIHDYEDTASILTPMPKFMRLGIGYQSRLG